MGRGTILANLGEGQYTIKLDFGESRLAAQLLLLTGANTELDTKIAAQQAKVTAAQTALNASNAALAVAIEAYVVGNSSPNLLPAVEAAKLDQVAKEEALRTETVAIGKLQSAKANNLRKIDQLNSYRASLTLDAWCADYTEAASGEVATLEIPNEPKTVLIAPGGRAPVDADGELRMRALMTPPQAYYNAAILPGWQKFKPTYRSGVITAISGDTADVLLDEAKSSASDIADIGLVNVEFDVNQTTTLTNVPIVYQDCNGTVFEVGDGVVVQFMSQSWSAPRIIGFLSNPKLCNKWYLIAYIRIASTNGPINYEWQAEYDYENQKIISNFLYTNNFSGFYNFAQIHNFVDGNDKIYVSFQEGGRIVKIQKAPDYMRIWQTSINDNVYAVTAKKYNGTWWIFAVTRGSLNSTQDIEKVARLNFDDGSVSVLLQKTINKVLAPDALRFLKSQNGNQIVAPYEYFEAFSGFTPIIRYTDKFANSKTQNIAYNLYTFSNNTVSASYDNKDASSTFNAHFYFNNNLLQKYQYNNFYPNIGRTYPINPQATFTDSISATDSESRSSSASATFTANNYDTLTNDFFGSVNNTIKVFFDPNYNISIDNIVSLGYVSTLYQVGDSFTRGVSQTYTISYLYNNNLLTTYTKNDDFPLSSDGYFPSLTSYTVSTNKAGQYFSNNVAIAYLPSIYALSYYYLNNAGNFNGMQQSNNSKITKLFEDALILDNRQNQYIESISFSLEFNSIL